MVKLVEENKLKREDILKLYTKGYTNPEDFKIGIEYERLPISTSVYNEVDYWSGNGIKQFLEKYSLDETWDYILDDKNIIGLKKGHDTITLEPGAQVEISAKPERTIFQIKDKIENINKGMNNILEKSDITLLDYGVSPYSTYKNINLIPKKRYEIMAKYLWGILSDVMMRETAGIQTCIDFSSENDAIEKFKLANMCSPFITAMFANSPIRGGVDTGYKSFRALSWLNTDNERCGFLNDKWLDFNSEYSFADYVSDIENVPMI